METSKTINYKGGKISFRAILGKKHKLAIMFVKYTTSQKRLLCAILQKFIVEKISAAPNNNNEITGASCTGEGIILQLPDVKIFSVLKQLHKYILNTKLNTVQSAEVGFGDFNVLHNNIGNFSVLITGKCQTIIKALGGSAPKKIENFVKGLNAIPKKDFQSFDMSKPWKPDEIEAPLNNDAKMLFVLAYGSAPYVFRGAKLIAYNPTILTNLAERRKYLNTFGGRCKAFISTFGNLTKNRDKNNQILGAVNMLAEMYSNLHGFSFKFTLNDLKQIDQNALAEMKKIKF